MKNLIVTLLLSGSVLAGVAAPAAAATAQDAAASATTLKRGVTLRTADGRRVGVIDNVVTKDGAPFRVQIIFNSHVIYVPASTITSDGTHFTTSLSYQDVSAL